MPTFQAYERDPRRWERCRELVRVAMVRDGWNPKAGKFGEVLRRKADKLYRQGGGK